LIEKAVTIFSCVFLAFHFEVFAELSDLGGWLLHPSVVIVLQKVENCVVPVLG
jgi:hypothetical protein